MVMRRFLVAGCVFAVACVQQRDPNDEADARQRQLLEQANSAHAEDARREAAEGARADREHDAAMDRMRARRAESSAPPPPVPASEPTGDPVTDSQLEWCQAIPLAERMRDDWEYLPHACGGKRFGCRVRHGVSSASRALHWLCEQAGGADSVERAGAGR